MNESRSALAKEYKFDEPLNQKMASINDNCIRDYHNRYFHTFDNICAYDIKLTNIANS